MELLYILLGLAVGGAIGFFVGKNQAPKLEGLAAETVQKLPTDPAFAEALKNLLHPPPPSTRPSGEPVRILALLQRDGRLIDFLQEDIAGAADMQIAAAIRDLHPKCRETLQKHLTLEPVIKGEEGKEVQVPTGFDPSAIQLTGNVTGNPPFKGVLRHPGWRVKEVKLPALPKGQDDLIVMPAEVEIV